jgi:hypothetical protein
MPAHQLGGKNECATAAEEAARVAWASSVFREGLTPRLTGAVARSAEGTNTGHKNAEGMASVGVRVEPTVRLWREGRALHLQSWLGILILMSSDA